MTVWPRAGRPVFRTSQATRVMCSRCFMIQQTPIELSGLTYEPLLLRCAVGEAGTVGRLSRAVRWGTDGSGEPSHASFSSQPTPENYSEHYPQVNTCAGSARLRLAAK